MYVVRLKVCISVFLILVISKFGFENMVLVLIVPVPGHCSHFTFVDLTHVGPAVVSDANFINLSSLNSGSHDNAKW